MKGKTKNKMQLRMMMKSKGKAIILKTTIKRRKTHTPRLSMKSIKGENEKENSNNTLNKVHSKKQ
jgi:hypothetical protein